MTVTIKKTAVEPALIGELGQFNLVRILQLLNQCRSNGVLQIKRGALYGVVYLDNGEIIDAHVLTYEGEDALYEMFLWLEGGFTFSPMKVVRNQTIKRPTEDLILTGARYDERWRKLCSVGINSATVLKAKSAEVIQRLLAEEEEVQLAQADQEFLKVADGRKTLNQIAQQYGYNRRKLVTILSFLLHNGFVDIISNEKVSPFGGNDQVFMPELDS